MNPITVAIGVVGLLFGIYTLYVRARKPEHFTKLKAMQEKFGDKPGYAVHVIGYSVIPIVFGAVMIFAGLKGVSFF